MSDIARITSIENSLRAARDCRSAGLYKEAALIAHGALTITDEEDQQYYPLKAEVAAAAYYCDDGYLREKGHAACEEMTMSRDCDKAVRHVSFQNLFHYTKKLSDYAPSFHAEKVEFEVPVGYYPTNPSICRWSGGLWLNVRCVNYYTDEDEKIILPAEEPLRTRNFLLLVDRDISRNSVIGEIKPPQDLPIANRSQPQGVEDLRIFPRNDGCLWASGTVVQANTNEMAEIMVAQIGSDLEMDRWRICNVAPWRHQKNWAPIIDWRSSGTPRFIYSYDPFHIFEDGLSLGGNMFPPIAAHTWSGSTQVIPWVFDGARGHLVMIHEKMYWPEMKFTRRWYQQRFVWYDMDWRLRKLSRRFQFDNGETEFPCGMCVHPDGERLVISYGVLDREAWLATIDIREVNDMLREVM